MIVTNFTEQDELAVFEAATGPLDESGGLNDFFGTIVDYNMDTAKAFDGVGLKRQLKITTQVDAAYSKSGATFTTNEWFQMPSNKDGTPKVDAAGKLVRPHKNSKWGRQEMLLKSLGVPYGGKLDGLIGLHAHFQEKNLSLEERVQAGKEATVEQYDVKGRFLVAWDGYDNQIREARGLTPITMTATSSAAQATGTGDPETDALSLLIREGSLIHYVSAIQKERPDLTAFANKPTVDAWKDKELVRLDNVEGRGAVYLSGPNCPF